MDDPRILAIKERLNIEDEIRRRGIELVRGASNRLEGCCPFHDDRRPSESVSVDMQRCHCFGCGADGDVLDFICAYDGRTLHEVLEELQGKTERYPRIRTRLSRLSIQIQRPSQEQGREADHTPILIRALTTYHTLLLCMPRAISYLQARGITVRGIRLCRLGYADGHILRSPLSVNEQLWQDARRAGLLTASGKEWLSGRIIIPDLGREGTCCWMIGRVRPALLFPEIAGVNESCELGTRSDGYARLVYAWHALCDGGEW
jgi:DNA primase